MQRVLGLATWHLRREAYRRRATCGLGSCRRSTSPNGDRPRLVQVGLDGNLRRSARRSRQAALRTCWVVRSSEIRRTGEGNLQPAAPAPGCSQRWGELWPREERPPLGSVAGQESSESRVVGPTSRRNGPIRGSGSEEARWELFERCEVAGPSPLTCARHWSQFVARPWNWPRNARPTYPARGPGRARPATPPAPSCAPGCTRAGPPRTPPARFPLTDPKGFLRPRVSQFEAPRCRTLPSRTHASWAAPGSGCECGRRSERRGILVGRLMSSMAGGGDRCRSPRRKASGAHRWCASRVP